MSLSLVKDRKFTIDELFKAGVISAKAHLYIDIHDKVKSLVKASYKMTKGKAIKEVAHNLNVGVTTVYRAVNMVESFH